MATPTTRPRLRPVESIVVGDAKAGRRLVLRDTQGVTEGQATMPLEIVPLVARFNGKKTCAEIAAEASQELGQEIPVDLVVRLATELESGLFLEGAQFEAARARVEDEFAKSVLRPASHAGGAYASDPKELARYLDEECLAAASVVAKSRPLVGLIAPHIDPWRGKVGYGHAYAALGSALPKEVDTFVLFGTSHAPMREPFALCRKGFATPLGAMSADLDAIDRLAAASPFDPYADLFNHKREHSLEFQVVFLKHLLGDRPALIVPILAGLGEHQTRGTDPEGDRAVTAFLDGVRALIDDRPGRVVVIAGADLAHVGPRFGDARGFDQGERASLEKTDRESLARATGAEPGAFWEDVARDLDTRRVCGLAPIYSLLRTLPGSRGSTLHYEQTIDEDDGSIVSHAAVAYFGES